MLLLLMLPLSVRQLEHSRLARVLLALQPLAQVVRMVTLLVFNAPLRLHTQLAALGLFAPVLSL
jgi:hypothetical protein